MSDADEMKALHEQISALENDRDQLEDMLGEAENYLQHKAICAWLLTKKPCDCGLVEFMTRVHELEEENGDEEEEDDEDE